eukprot:g21771.t1
MQSTVAASSPDLVADIYDHSRLWIRNEEQVKDGKGSRCSPPACIQVFSNMPEPSICTLWDEYGDDSTDDHLNTTTPGFEEPFSTSSDAPGDDHNQDFDEASEASSDDGTSIQRSVSESPSSFDGETGENGFQIYAHKFANRFSLPDEALQELIQERTQYERSQQLLHDEISALRAQVEQDMAALHQAKVAVSRLYSQNLGLARAAGQAQAKVLQAEKSMSPPPLSLLETKTTQPQRRAWRRSLGSFSPRRRRSVSNGKKSPRLDKNENYLNRSKFAFRPRSPPVLRGRSRSGLLRKEDRSDFASDGAQAKQQVVNKRVEAIPEETLTEAPKQ